MPNSIKSFTDRNYKISELDEYFKESLANSEYGYMIYQPKSTSTHITLKVGRVGLAIGRRGKNIKSISDNIKKILGDENVRIEVEPLDEPENHANVMAARLASSLERGRHFRRSAYGIMRRIMATGALGVEITISGKITSQRARVESFKEGYIAKTGHIVTEFVQKGLATAKIKRGTLGITVLIMVGDAIIPDHVEIIAEPTHTTREITRTEDAEEFGELDEAEEFDESVLDEEFGELEEIKPKADEDIPEEAMEALDEDLEELEE